jgi:hypothetical protein
MGINSPQEVLPYFSLIAFSKIIWPIMVLLLLLVQVVLIRAREGLVRKRLRLPIAYWMATKQWVLPMMAVEPL